MSPVNKKKERKDVFAIETSMSKLVPLLPSSPCPFLLPWDALYMTSGPATVPSGIGTLCVASFNYSLDGG